MDVTEAGKEIRRAVDTGNVIFGVKESLHHLRMGEGQLVVLAQNTPVLTQEDVKHLASMAEVPLFRFEGTGLDLGNVCGKPYVISTLLVLDGGKSKVQDLTREKVGTDETEEETPPSRKRKGRKPAPR